MAAESNLLGPSTSNWPNESNVDLLWKPSASVDRTMPSPSPSAISNQSHTGIAPKGVRLHMMTWNVAGIKPPSNMEDALALTTVPLPDMYCIGLQEVTGNPGSSDIRDWIDTLTWLLADYDFVRIKSRQQLGMLIVVFVHRSLLPHCTHFESEVTRTGLFGLWGNKGGVSIRLDVCGVNVIMVNCHLAAHLANVAERITDYDAILDDQKFKDPDVDNILDHDYVFWMGDLNFRIDNMSREEVDRAIENKQYKKLLDNDQLNRCREEKLIFEDFQEMDINFPPTYKFDGGTNVYDSSPKRRVPAWCDRVLWQTYTSSYTDINLRVDPLRYTSHPCYMDSDHKPVSATFFFTVFPKPPHSPVQFCRQRIWQRGEKQVVKYIVNKHHTTSGSDWIGLYRANFYEFENYVSYTWAMEGAELQHHTIGVTFPGQVLMVKPGSYCLCYLTKKYSLVGISKVFQIV